MIGWCPLQREASLTWSKQVTWLTMQSKMAELIQEKAVLSQKKAIFQEKMKASPQLYTSKTTPTNLGGILHTKTTQIISHITQFRVIKHLLWFPTIHLPITKHKLYQHTYLSQTVSQALQGLTTLRITNIIILDPQEWQDLQWNQFRYHISNYYLGSSKVN